MAKTFDKLRNKMPAKVRDKANAKTQKMLQEISLQKLKKARWMFNEFLESVKEMDKILKGKKRPSRKFVFKKSNPKGALCALHG